MIGCRGLATLAVCLGLMATTAAPTDAQDPYNDCGVICVQCGFFNLFSEGAGFSEEGDFHMSCLKFRKDNCTLCNDTTTTYSVSEMAPTETEIVRAIKGTRRNHLDEVVARYGERMFIHPSRNLLAIRGLGCKSEHVVAVAFVTADETAALLGFGVRHLDEFFDQRPDQDLW